MTPDQAAAVLAADPGALERARAQLRDTKARRIAAQKRLEGVGTTAKALTAAARDRDAGSTEVLDALRHRVDELCDRLEGMCGDTDRRYDSLRRLFVRDAVHRDDPHVLRVQEALAAEADVREQIKLLLEDARVPLELAAATTINVRMHVDPDLQAALDENAAEQAARDAARTRKTVHELPGQRDTHRHRGLPRG